MRLLIDHKAILKARYLNKVKYNDVRRYYLVDKAIIVVRNDHDLNHLTGEVVDASVGWDTAQPGFCKEEDIGIKQTKITIYRPLPRRGSYATLTHMLSLDPVNIL